MIIGDWNLELIHGPKVSIFLYFFLFFLLVFTLLINLFVAIVVEGFINVYTPTTCCVLRSDPDICC